MRRLAGLGFLLLLLLFACQPRISTEPVDAGSRAGRVLAELYTRNAGLKTCKGIGSIRLWKGGASQSARFAWLASTDGRMRAELLGPAGRPLLKLAYDGRRFFYSRGFEDGVQSRRVKNPSLGRVIDVPITVKELALFLAGRFPVYEHADVRLLEGIRGQGRKELVLTDDWRGLEETILFSESPDRVVGVRILEDGGLRYRAALSDFRQRGGFLVPARLSFKSEADAGFEIRWERFWPNAPVRKEQFVVSPA
jgi:outer membrane biogenesis lipoprotein LolB